MTPGAGIFRTQLPQGFSAGGVNCGVRRYRPDLGVIISDDPCVATAVLTQNTCKAAPVTYCEELLPSSKIKAILTNSGQANAATGQQGVINNQKIVDSLATELSCDSQQVLIASTGVIGEQVEVEKITAAMPMLVNSVTNIAEKFAVSILTTDLVPKTVHKEIKLSQGTVIITGICKGSGMIHPNMATMLGYLLTDAIVSVEQSQGMLKKVCDKSFNMISVDGDTSTNDGVFMLANGMSQVSLSNESDIAIFYQALEEIAITLAKSIARDGEGASKLIEVKVMGLAEEMTAKKIARSITTSPLIKTAIYGESPNWGRILAKVGSEMVSQDLINHCDIVIQGLALFSKGALVSDEAPNNLRKKMREDTIFIDIHFNDGKQHATAWGCDLTEKYVTINAEYLT